MATPWWFLAPGVLLADAFLTPLGRAVPGLLLRHALMAWDAERPDVRHCALAAPLHDGHDVVGIPVGAAPKEPPVAVPELGPVSPLLLGPRSLDPAPLRVEGHAELGGIDAAESTDTVVAAKHALTHQCRAVSGRPVIDASLTAEATAPLWNLGVAVAAERTTVWPSRKRLGLDPSSLRADPAGTHAGSIRIANFAMGFLTHRANSWARPLTGFLSVGHVAYRGDGLAVASCARCRARSSRPCVPSDGRIGRPLRSPHRGQSEGAMLPR